MAIAALSDRRTQWLLFGLAFFAFAYFHQGGGWNQNARFAMVRSIVEEGSFSIDSHLVYAGVPSPEGTRLVRIPVRNAEFSFGGRSYAFWWRDREGRTIFLNSSSGAAGREVVGVTPEEAASTGDVSFYRGRFHPAKAPGGSFIAVPAYFLLYHFERAIGIDPDGWWPLTVNAWLTSALSIGLLSAAGCVLLYRLALKLSSGQALASLLTALTFAFGAMFFPYATALYEHNIVAVALLASFYALHRAKAAGSSLSEREARLSLALAGLSAGSAAVTNYIVAAALLLLLWYLFSAVRRKRGWLWFGMGALAPLLLLAAYNIACFSTPFTTNYSHENPVFKEGGSALLGVFFRPQGDVLLSVLFSPYRGLFVSAPVLLLSGYGLFRWLRSEKVRSEAALMLGLVAFFLLFIVSFNGWHGGWAVGPRYLTPALPFLALPLVVCFLRFFRVTTALAVISIAAGLLITAVDPQSPAGNARMATVEGRPQWRYSPLTEYEGPLFFQDHPWPLLRAQRDTVVQFYDGLMQANGEPPSVRTLRLAALAEEIDADIRSGAPAPLLLARDGDGRIGIERSDLSTFVGPVSVNPMGMYEGWLYRVFPARSVQAAGNSFNAGELLFPQSRWSLAPLTLIAAAVAAVALRRAMTTDT